MAYSFIVLLVELYRWACLFLCAYALILGGISLFALIINVFKLMFRQDNQFRWYHLVKTLFAAAVAYGYYFLYGYKGINAALLRNDTPKAVILLIVSLCLPIGLLSASDYLLLAGTKPKKK